MPLELKQLRTEIELEAARLRDLPAGKTELKDSLAGSPGHQLVRAFEDALAFETPIESTDNSVCDVRAILRFDGHEFVRNCYRQILRREADADGLAYYYDLLERGKQKSEIVLRMRASREGRIAGTRLTGWIWPGLHLAVVSIPVLGYFADAMIEGMLLPRTLRRLILRQELLREKINRLVQK